MRGGVKRYKHSPGGAIFGNDRGKDIYKKASTEYSMFYVSDIMLGKGKVDWYNSDGFMEPSQYQYIKIQNNRNIAMRAEVTPEAAEKAKKKAKLFINDNYAYGTGRGGGRGCNGQLFMGDVSSVKVTKNWVDDGTHPASVTVRLLEDGVEKDKVTLDKNNNWSYEFLGLEVNLVGRYPDDKFELAHEYTITEDPIQGYDTEIPDPVITWDSKGKVPTLEYTITNTRNNEAIGQDLYVSKRVEGEGADPEKLFEFNITFEPGDKPIPYTIDNGGTGGTITGSTGSFKLKHGQTARFFGISKDVKYTVVEKEYDDYTSQSPNHTQTGTIEDSTIRIEFINTKISIEPEIKIGTKANGGGVIGKSVTIEDVISYENLTPGTEYTLKGWLMNKNTEKQLEIQGKPLPEIVYKFTPDTPNDEVKMNYTFDASEFTNGLTVVVFEELYLGNELIATHKVLDDLNQTVTFTEVPPPPAPQRLHHHQIQIQVIP